jgi:alcohol dehydrogenase (cytochrome c)
MRGATAAPILAYVRHHVDIEVADRIRTAHPAITSMTLADEEMKLILAEVRVLAGTSPTMATGGFTGTRGRGGQPAGGRGSGALTTPPAGAAGVGPGAGRGGGGGRAGGAAGRSGPVSIRMADGRTLTGTLAGESEFDATMYADGRFYLLSKDGDLYREKPLEPKRDWATYHGTIDSQRFSTLDQINMSNVRNLAPAWIFSMPNSQRLQAVPLVVDGVMYMTGWNEIYAIDATTGRQLWTFNRPRTEGILGDAGAGSHRGAAIAGDRVFMVTDDAHVLAFNRFTGEKLWEVEMGRHEDGFSATVPGLVVGDLLIQGMSGGDEGTRGFLDAYRVTTGERVWRFYTIPKRGEPGSETWIGQAIDHGCGATWQTGSYDPELGLLFWTTGNPCPAHTLDERLGDNLYTSSVVALEANTGKLRWHYQFSPHDTNDWDATQPVVLVDDVWQGQPRKLLVQANRNGMFYVLDRTNGQVLLVDKLVSKVTWNLGFTKDGRPIYNPAAVPTQEGIALCPGPNGGANWPPVSYSPVTKLLYVRVADSCGISTASEDPLTGNRWFGEIKPDPPKAQQALAALLEGYQTGNYIRAMDPFTGKKVWDYPVPGGRTGPLATAGGLVFLGGSGGLVALDARTGAPVSNINVAQNSMSSPMTYMVSGKQYIALPGTGTIVAYALR